MRSVTILIAAMTVAMACPAQSVPADSAQYQLTIERQSLSAALQEFAKQSGVQIIFFSNVTDGYQAPAVKGKFTASDALSRLLNDSTLTFRELNEKTIEVQPKVAVKSQAHAAGGYSQMSLVSPASENNPVRVAQTGTTANKSVMQPVAAEEDTSKISEIVVSTSRLAKKDVPTPLLTITADVLQEASRPNIVASLQDMPQFKAGVGAQNAGGFNPGAYSVDLRALNPFRSLVLVNGRRLVGDFLLPDLAVVPSVLIDRVDVVTGGASAAWGSNAIAGVVNMIVDDTFEGLKLGVRGGVSSRHDVKERALEGAFGAGFLDGKGHFIAGAEYIDNDGGGMRTSRPGTGRWAVVNQVLTEDVGDARVGSGGLILTGVNAGKAFNPDGTLRAFDRGTVVNNNAYGGEAGSLDDVTRVFAPSERLSAMARATYDFNDSFTLTADVIHSRVADIFQFFGNPNNGDITVTLDNAFLPSAIRAQMVGAGQTSFTMGRLNEDYAWITQDYVRTTTQASLQLDGKVGQTFGWQAYLTHGEFEQDVDLRNQRISGNFAFAVDAVTSPTSGLPVCRVTLTNPAINCYPINLFGNGAPSQQARDYVLSTSIQRLHTGLEAAGMTLRGEPFDLWAGRLSMAAGVEARHDIIRQKNGPNDRFALNTPGGFTLANFPAFSGANTTKEGFAEVQLPVLRDIPMLRLLQVNGAIRSIRDQSGTVNAWKLGLIDQVADGVQVRVARSQDIRSANVDELYRVRTEPSIIRPFDPFTNTNPQALGFSGGNPALQPEVAHTLTAGITIEPPAVPSLSLSVDYYDIEVEDAISSLPVQNVINGCFAGNSGLCNAIRRDANGVISTVDAALLNFQSLKTSGIDVALGYTLSLGSAGALRLRSNVTWTREYSIDDGLPTTPDDFVGSLSRNNGAPKIKAVTAVYYDIDKFEANIRGRYVSSGNFDLGQVIVNNRIPAFLLADVGVRFNLSPRGGSDVGFFANVNNVLGKDAPPGSANQGWYETVGRYYAAGMQLKF